MLPEAFIKKAMDSQKMNVLYIGSSVSELNFSMNSDIMNKINRKYSKGYKPTPREGTEVK